VDKVYNEKNNIHDNSVQIEDEKCIQYRD